MSVTSRIIGAVVGVLGSQVLVSLLWILDFISPSITILSILTVLGGVIGFAAASGSDEFYGTGDIPDYKKYELQKVANKGSTSIFFISLVYPPAGYYLVGKTGLAALCFFTAHFGTIAHIVAPFHTRRIIKKARKQLRRAEASNQSQETSPSGQSQRKASDG